MGKRRAASEVGRRSVVRKAPMGALCAALLGGCAVGGGSVPTEAGSGMRLSPAAYVEAATRRAAGAGLSVGAVSAVTGEQWRAVAEDSPSLGAALARARPPGVEIETRSRGFCARSRESNDCMFVTVLGATSGERFADLDPARVDAVVVVRTAPPDAESRMQWREELRTGRLFVFLSGWRPPYPP